MRAEEIIIEGARRAAVRVAINLGSGSVEAKIPSYNLSGQADDRREVLRLRSNKLGKSVDIDCQLSCSRSKNIVATAINGLDGTIKEWYSNGDVAISAEFTLVGEGNEYPQEEVERVCQVLESAESLQVENETLNDVYGVTRVVVNSWSMTPTKAFNYQTFSVQMTSDEAYVIMEEIEA